MNRRLSPLPQVMTTIGLIGERKHRQHRGAARGRRRPRRRAEQQPRSRDAAGPGRRARPTRARRDGRGSGGRRRPRRRHDPVRGRRQGARRAVARQGRDRHLQLLPQRDGHVAALDDENTTSSELVQAHLPESKVVKGFNNISYIHLRGLARPAGSPERSVLAIAGDDSAAKAEVTAFLDSIGYDAYDAGPLAEGWRLARLRKTLARDQLADLVAIDKRLAVINAEIRAAVAASRST